MPWNRLDQLRPIPYKCAYCDREVASAAGYSGHFEGIRICPLCAGPTFFSPYQIPAPPPGASVAALPDDISAIYSDARFAAGANAHTASVLACRKLLMHIAVDRGAQVGLTFLQYVEYLANHGFVPPDGRSWVDHIRRRGNEANHEIVVMTSADSSDLILFSEMLLRFIYEFPARIPKPSAPA